ncbi:MAG: SDR family oxidoreductase [Pseudomonadota bacterium]
MAGRRRALVTGGSQRVGRAMVLDLAANGWDVAIHFNGSAEAAAATAQECRELGAAAVTLQADLADHDAVEQLVPRAVSGLGGALELLINNASTFKNDEIGSISGDSWMAGMDSNLRAPMMLTQSFAAQSPSADMDANGEPVARAVVINIIDQRVWKPTPFFVSYLVAKSGLLAFTRSAAQALAPNVRIAGIGPGPTLRATRQSKDHYAQQRRSCILGRGSDPEDIVSAMNFIISNKAFTGQMLAIDGGQHLIWQTPDVQGMIE